MQDARGSSHLSLVINCHKSFKIPCLIFDICFLPIICFFFLSSALFVRGAFSELRFGFLSVFLCASALRFVCFRDISWFSWGIEFFLFLSSIFLPIILFSFLCALSALAREFFAFFISVNLWLKIFCFILLNFFLSVLSVSVWDYLLFCFLICFYSF